MRTVSTSRTKAATQTSRANLPAITANLQAAFAERFERIRLTLCNRLPHGSKQVIADRIPRGEKTSRKTLQERVSREINGERDAHLATVIVSRDYLQEIGDLEAVEQINTELRNGPVAVPIKEGKVFDVFGKGGQLFIRFD